jgi:hypothetical protein
VVLPESIWALMPMFLIFSMRVAMMSSVGERTAWPADALGLCVKGITKKRSRIWQ